MIDRVITGLRKRLRIFATGRSSRITSARFDSSDITQEAVCQVWHEIEKSGVEDAVISNTWLYSICHGKAANLHRHNLAQKRSAVADKELHENDSFIEQDPHQLAEEHEQVDLLFSAINELSSDERLVVQLRFFEQMTLLQIAAETQLTIDKVRTLLDRAMTKLKKRIQEID